MYYFVLYLLCIIIVWVDREQINNYITLSPKVNAEIYMMPAAQIYPLAIGRLLSTELINYFIVTDY